MVNKFEPGKKYRSLTNNCEKTRIIGTIVTAYSATKPNNIYYTGLDGQYCGSLRRDEWELVNDEVTIFKMII